MPFLIIGFFPAVLIAALAYLFFTDDEPAPAPVYPARELERLAEEDPFAELDVMWCAIEGIDWAGSGVPSLRWRADGLPSRPASHSRNRRGF